MSARGSHGRSGATSNAEERELLRQALAKSMIPSSSPPSGAAGASSMPAARAAAPSRIPLARGSHGHSGATTNAEEQALLQSVMAETMPAAAGAAGASSMPAAAGAAGASSMPAAAAAAAAPAAAGPGLSPAVFLQRFPSPPDLQAQARDIFGDYLGVADIHSKVDQKIAEVTAADVSISEVIPPSQGRGGLYHGNAGAAANAQTLRQYNIRLIIQTTVDHEPKQRIRAALAQIPEASRPLILELDMVDNEHQRLDAVLSKALAYEPHGNLTLLDLMRTVREDGGNILVNCTVGMSRSTAIVLMHLMDRRSENMRLLDAWRFLKMKRPLIFPNYGFVQQLQQYEVSTRGAPGSVSRELLALHPLAQFYQGGYRKLRRSKKTRKTRRHNKKKSRRH
jgi:protein-tyrosine phosphatase